MIKIFGSVLLFFYNICNSYGGAILLFGLLVKLIMLPFQMKSKHSMMRTTMLTPRVKELEKRYATNKQKYQEEVAKLYKEAKINPMSGCLWTLIPFPIVIILYSVVRQPLVALMKLTQENITTLTDVVTQLGYYTAPAKTDVYSQMTIANVLHEHFADIVSNPGVAEFADKLKNINFHFLGLNMIEKPSLMFWNTPEWQNGLWYIALLMFLIPFISAGLTILQTTLSQKMNPPQDAQTAQTSKTMNLVMPLMSIYICFIMPVSMGLYWIEQSVLGIIQEAILNRYYKTKLDAEMAEFNEAQRKKDAEMEAKRAETEAQHGRADGQHRENAVRFFGQLFAELFCNQRAAAGSEHEARTAEDHQNRHDEVDGCKGRFAREVRDEEAVYHAVDRCEDHHDDRRRGEAQKPPNGKMIG